MNSSSFAGRCALALLVGGVLAAAPALADKPSSKAGKGKSASQERSRPAKDEAQRADKAIPAGTHFQDRHRSIAHDYYSAEFQRGRCPPGLAKKNNGCLPPGQAKKWAVGKPLPRDVIFYDIPRPLAVQLGAPPAHHRYVRVAGDILLIAMGTGMVIDGLQDLGRM